MKSLHVTIQTKDTGSNVLCDSTDCSIFQGWTEILGLSAGQIVQFCTIAPKEDDLRLYIKASNVCY